MTLRSVGDHISLVLNLLDFLDVSVRLIVDKSPFGCCGLGDATILIPGV